MRTSGLTSRHRSPAALGGSRFSSSTAIADDRANARPTITATVTLPPGRSGGNGHPAPHTPAPSLLLASPLLMRTTAELAATKSTRSTATCVLRASSRFGTTPSATHSTATALLSVASSACFRITCSDPTIRSTAACVGRPCRRPTRRSSCPARPGPRPSRSNVPSRCDQPDRRRCDQPRHVARGRGSRAIRGAGGVQQRGLGGDDGDARHDHVRLRRRHTADRVRRRGNADPGRPTRQPRAGTLRSRLHRPRRQSARTH